MKIAIIAPPFIPVPPARYGGTELFIAQLAEGLKQKGVEVIVYANGESTVGVETRWLYPRAEWPLTGETYDNLKDLNHTSWALRDAVRSGCDLLHINNVPGILFSRFTERPMLYTMHHPNIQELSDIFSYFPAVHYVTISDFQRRRERMPLMRTIHHGIDLEGYRCVEQKQDYLAFIGRIAPEKGTGLAIEVARRSGIPLKIAGEVQPCFREYFDREIKPHVDGKFIQYLGEADLAAKNELLGNARAMLFPIQWEEPFGLVMIEAMACGTPVLALPGGSVPEIVRDGVSGYLCNSTAEMVARAKELALEPAAVRQFVARNFSVTRMVEDYVRLYREILTGGATGDDDGQGTLEPAAA